MAASRTQELGLPSRASSSGSTNGSTRGPNRSVTCDDAGEPARRRKRRKKGRGLMKKAKQTRERLPFRMGREEGGERARWFETQ